MVSGAPAWSWRPFGGGPGVMPGDASEVPTWDGDPSSFESFVTSCRWFEAALKNNEKKLAAPRIWQRLAGSAKSVVRHLDPGNFSGERGLSKLLDVLGSSPLQRLPVPDSFQRLERWSSMRRTPNETIAQLLVREEELIVDLQQFLRRAQHEQEGLPPPDLQSDPTPHMGTSPSQSPTAGPAQFGATAAGTTSTSSPTGPTMDASTSPTGGYFEDELRGYRLLKPSRLSTAERQHILTMTGNSTRYHFVRRALRSLFAADGTWTLT